MERVIWKYQLAPLARAAGGEAFIIKLPLCSEVLSVQVQSGEPVLWAAVYPNSKLQARRFCIIATGQPYEEEGLKYIGTFQMIGGQLVLHLFEQVG